MNEQLLIDYTTENKIRLQDGSTLDSIRCAGEYVLFRETDPSGYYHEHHEELLLDIMGWLYTKLSANGEVKNNE